MSELEPIRILVAGADGALRAQVCQLRENNSRIMVIGETDSTQDAVALAQAHHPDLVLIDMAIHGTNGLAATRELKEQRPNVAVILFTVLNEQEYLGIARHSGVDRCLNKREVERKLLPLIDSLLTPIPPR